MPSNIVRCRVSRCGYREWNDIPTSAEHGEWEWQGAEPNLQVIVEHAPCGYLVKEKENKK